MCVIQSNFIYRPALFNSWHYRLWMTLPLKSKDVCNVLTMTKIFFVISIGHYVKLCHKKCSLFIYILWIIFWYIFSFLLCCLLLLRRRQIHLLYSVMILSSHMIKQTTGLPSKLINKCPSSGISSYYHLLNNPQRNTQKIYQYFLIDFIIGHSFPSQPNWYTQRSQCHGFFCLKYSPFYKEKL